MSDIKKKFLDILFEPESEEIEAEAPLTEVKEKTINKETVLSGDIVAPKAKDILYGKQDNKHSSFIDYYVVPKKEKPIEDVQEEAYEMRGNVSPIFGTIAQKEKRKKPVNDKDVQKAIASGATSDEYVGVVISPIYGYDANKANDARRSLNDRNNKIEDDDYNEELAFEMPKADTMNETIKEAIQEAVIELTPSNNQLEEDEEEEYEEEVNEEVQEDILTEEETVEEPVEEPQIEDVTFEDFIPDEVYNIEDEIDPVLEEEYKQEEKEEIEDIQEETSEEKIEDLEEDIEEQAFKALFDNEKENEPQESLDEKVPKANRSIYDTTPIQLFDFDSLTEVDKEEKDLLDELIGDDD